jgi:molybdate transport system permease protein
MNMPIDWGPLILSLELATTVTLVLIVIGVPLAYYLSRIQGWSRAVLETLITMPLVLPPTVLGFYMLVVLSPNSWLGGVLERMFGIQLLFSFAGLVIGSVIFSLPFMVGPLLNGLEGIPESLVEASYTLGKSKLHTLFRVQLPTIRASILSALVLTFAHTIGEFGVVLMIGGNIPGKTRVASIAIYSELDALNYRGAEEYALILLLFSFVVILIVRLVGRGRDARFNAI